MQEIETDVARHTASHPTWYGRAKLHMQRAGQRAHRVRSGVTRSTLLKIEQEEARDAFLAKAWKHPDWAAR
eukprot:2232311-Amphidinium_carterae.2